MVTVKSKRGESISVLTVELFLLFDWLRCGLARSLLVVSVGPSFISLVVLSDISAVVPSVISPFIIPVVPSVLLAPANWPTSAATITLTWTVRSEIRKTLTVGSKFRKALTDFFLTQLLVDIDSVFHVVLGPVQLWTLDLIKLFLDALVKLRNIPLQLFELLAFCDCGVFQKSCLVLQNLNLSFDFQGVPQLLECLLGLR